MTLPENKTKIVCTIGPASEPREILTQMIYAGMNAREILTQMIYAGMNVARINFSHGDFPGHARVIETIRAAAGETGRRVAVMADLPGPKMRIGEFEKEPVELKSGDVFTLTTQDISGNGERVSVTFEGLPRAVKPGDRLFLNDGLVQLQVKRVEGTEVACEVLVGGELRARKGLNLPGIDLGISAFTEHDRECLEFALAQGVDAVGQSFVERAADVEAVREAAASLGYRPVERAADVEAVREAAASLGYRPFIIAKIERIGALDHLDEILDAADGIMVARGDLGVEIPIEKIPVVQKQIMRKALYRGKPVITATQMLESMTGNRRPTRAEATDVANAILDGTDCVMLSAESAMGAYPVAATRMLARIAAAIEPQRSRSQLQEALKKYGFDADISLKDLIALSILTTVERVTPATIMVPTESGATARNITRFRLPVWISAFSPSERTCRELQFSYGVYAVHEPELPEEWNRYASEHLGFLGEAGGLVVLAEGPSPRNPEANHRMELIELENPANGGTDDR
ncbi:MAG: pyruvate kinase [Deltaproteobacteria bacterium]|nr:pyruvate kinase [Deltaproteobacteria bacterium]